MRSALATTLLLALSLAQAAPAGELPPEGRCGGTTTAIELDASRAPLRSGDVVDRAAVGSLRDFLPAEIWAHRDTFFFDGMQLTIGACHRRYPASRAYEDATRARAGNARLDAEGNLSDHAAGMPFPPETLDANAADAGARWAWNLERRHRGAGPRGEFRLLDLPSAAPLARRALPQAFVGEFFFAQTGQRADLAGFRERAARGSSWVAGGSFREPTDARGLAWRQYRATEAARDGRRADDVFVFVPDLRKTRRAASAHADGMFVPRYRAAGQGNARAIPYAQGGRLGSVEAGHAGALAATEDIARGFSAFALRPNAWVWRVVAERELLAPLNARNEGWPLRAGRNYGPSGLSLASDTWDLRWAVAIEGRARSEGVPLPLVTLWLDAQTAQPLFVVRRDASGALRELGVLAHRYSGDVPSYPALPNGEAANVFDPVAEAFLVLPGGGWRRESWGVRSLPLEADALRRLLSTDALSREQ